MHESILPDTPVTDYHDHDIPSSSRVHIYQCPTLKLYYKNRLYTLDTGGTASLSPQTYQYYWQPNKQFKLMGNHTHQLLEK